MNPIPSEINPPTGCKINSAAKTDNVKVIKGVINKSNTSGTNFLQAFSINTDNNTTNITEIIPPLPGVKAFPNKVILAKAEDDSIPPKTPPIIGICEPNSLAAFTPTSIDNIENTPFPINPII